MRIPRARTIIVTLAGIAGCGGGVGNLALLATSHDAIPEIAR